MPLCKECRSIGKVKPKPPVCDRCGLEIHTVPDFGYIEVKNGLDGPSSLKLFRDFKRLWFPLPEGIRRLDKDKAKNKSHSLEGDKK